MPFQKQFKLPPISPATFPVLLTPAHLKVSNYSLFDFDSAYKKMMSELGAGNK